MYQCFCAGPAWWASSHRAARALRRRPPRGTSCCGLDVVTVARDGCRRGPCPSAEGASVPLGHVRGRAPAPAGARGHERVGNCSVGRRALVDGTPAIRPADDDDDEDTDEVMMMIMIKMLLYIYCFSYRVCVVFQIGKCLTIKVSSHTCLK